MTKPPGSSEAESRQVAEEAREAEWTAPSFLKELFLGNFRLDLVHPFPPAPPERENARRIEAGARPQRREYLCA